MLPNMQVESSTTPFLTVDEVEQVHRQRVVSLIGHVFQLTYAAMLDALIQDEKVNHCNGYGVPLRTKSSKHVHTILNAHK